MRDSADAATIVREEELWQGRRSDANPIFEENSS